MREIHDKEIYRNIHTSNINTLKRGDIISANDGNNENDGNTNDPATLLKNKRKRPKKVKEESEEEYDSDYSDNEEEMSFSEHESDNIDNKPEEFAEYDSLKKKSNKKKRKKKNQKKKGTDTSKERQELEKQLVNETETDENLLNQEKQFNKANSIYNFRRRIRKYMFTKSHKKKCIICFDEINEPAKLDGCDHEFCFPCIKSWSQLTNFCPICKKEFVKILYLRNNIQTELRVIKQKFKFYDLENNEETSKICFICNLEQDSNPLNENNSMEICVVCKYNVCHSSCLDLKDIQDDGWICKVCKECLNE